MKRTARRLRSSHRKSWRMWTVAVALAVAKGSLSHDTWGDTWGTVLLVHSISMVTSPTHSRNSLGPVPVSSLFAVWLLLLFLAQTSVGWAQSPDARAFIADKYLSTDDHQLRLNIANRFDRQNLKDHVTFNWVFSEDRDTIACGAFSPDCAPCDKAILKW